MDNVHWNYDPKEGFIIAAASLRDNFGMHVCTAKRNETERDQYYFVRVDSKSAFYHLPTVIAIRINTIQFF